ncbi:MAG: YchF-related putative GTPase [Candidatus Thermoplasmatota archaeon]|jgi:small GTP-binding protein|nr:YchF-related putative GTPase [Candidatus Thermoplasmatota archaeon]
MSSPKIGLIGKPNVGKSTIFSALTEASAEIANYPFTTTKPNVGITYFPVECPHPLVGGECNPREGFCDSGKRYVPITVIDVPGLIEGASHGKGMGNEFLENVRDSDAIILVFDASGRTSLDGSVLEESLDLGTSEIAMVRNELQAWFSRMLGNGWEKFSRKADSSGQPVVQSLQEKLGSFGISQGKTHLILASAPFPAKLALWTETDFGDFARIAFELVKPVILVGNKADLVDHPPKIGEESRFVSADFELAASRAKKAGLVMDADTSLDPVGSLTDPQKNAIERINSVFSRSWVKRLRIILAEIVRDRLRYIVVFPVYDEKKWTDKEGNVLPDAFLMEKGSTAEDLAYKVHSEIGRGFIRAIDCRTGMVVARDHQLSDGDVIKIVSKA